MLAGSASRTAAVSSRRRRSTTAFVKWVVPIITAVTWSGGQAPLASTCSSAETMPELTFAVVGVLCVATTDAPSISTASVFVPPTSTPMRIASPPIESPTEWLTLQMSLRRMQRPDARAERTTGERHRARRGRARHRRRRRSVPGDALGAPGARGVRKPQGDRAGRGGGRRAPGLAVHRRRAGRVPREVPDRPRARVRLQRARPLPGRKSRRAHVRGDGRRQLDRAADPRRQARRSRSSTRTAWGAPIPRCSSSR